MESDPFGQALLDHCRGERTEPLIQRDGETTLEHSIEEFYFVDVETAEPGRTAWLEETLDGPLLDLGAGAGKHTLHFQEQFETVALEVSEELVDVLHERGVEDARQGDMFALRSTFERDQFRSALAWGTQIGLAGSMDGLRNFLGDLAFVTTPDATAVLDSYDPTMDATAELLGYRADPTPGQASRVIHFEYNGTVGVTLLFRLFSPETIREATTGTGWDVRDVSRDEDGPHFAVTLQKA